MNLFDLEIRLRFPPKSTNRQHDETQQEQHGVVHLLVRRVQEARLRHEARTCLPLRSKLLTDVRAAQQRLGNESMRRFDACALCLQRARDPVACQKGHLFCRECVLTDLGAFTPFLRPGEGVCVCAFASRLDW